jgi:hypothetical protein
MVLIFTERERERERGRKGRGEEGEKLISSLVCDKEREK